MMTEPLGMRFLWKVPRAYRKVCHDCGGLCAALAHKQPPRLRITRIRCNTEVIDLYVEPLCTRCWERYQREG